MDEYWITEAMLRMGGSFVKKLGELYRLGDANNQQKLKEAFPEYWNTYTEHAMAHRCEWVD